MPNLPASCETLPDRRAEFTRGFKEALPVLLGLIPFALILGAQAGQKQMSPLETALMMGLNYAGGSEFAAVALWANPIPVLTILGMTLMLNSRHILLGMVFAPTLAKLPLAKILPLLFLMTDESWAMAMAETQKRRAAGLGGILNVPYYLGVSLPMYVLWVGCGFIGATAGPFLGDMTRFGFQMAFPAVFLVLLRGMWQGRRQALPWFVSLLTAAAVYLWLPENGWYVPAGVTSGLTVAFFQGGRRD